jgi:hypothetical protein
VYDAVARTLDALVAEQCVADPTLTRDAALRKVVRKYPDLYGLHADIVKMGLTPAPLKPVAKSQALTPRQQADLDATTAAQAVLAAGLADNLADAYAIAFKRDLALYDRWRANVPGAVTVIAPQPAPASSVAPPPAERDRGLG